MLYTNGTLSAPQAYPSSSPLAQFVAPTAGLYRIRALISTCAAWGDIETAIPGQPAHLFFITPDHVFSEVDLGEVTLGASDAVELRMNTAGTGRFFATLIV